MKILQDGLPGALTGTWRATARLFREHEAASVAIAYEKCAADLEDALGSAGDVTFSLVEAADRSGYSADHLGRLIREGKIPNAGRPGAPRIALRDLPRKAEVATGQPDSDLSRTQIVRSAIKRGVS